MAAARGCKAGLWAVLMLVLSGCVLPDGDGPARPAWSPFVLSSPRPQPNPQTLNAPLRAVPVASSDELRQRYQLFETRLLSRGYLRQDRGGADPVDAETLATNFIRIALYDEYTPVDGQLVAQETASRLRRWTKPVRVSVTFDDTLPPEARTSDLAEIDALIGELATATEHPIARVEGEADFSVFVVGEERRLTLRPQLRALVPGVTEPVLRSMLDILPSTFCLVVAFSSPDAPQTYMKAVAIIRAEHPDVLRRACYHEEISQGLGLANDSRAARPSIFNDDEEFALLTEQDQLMLRILYDPRLTPGMDIVTAEPIVQNIARELIPPVVADTGLDAPPPAELLVPPIPASATLPERDN